MARCRWVSTLSTIRAVSCGLRANYSKSRGPDSDEEREDDGGHFQIRNASNQHLNMHAGGSQSLVSGHEKDKWWGMHYWGSSLASYDEVANLYDGAYRTWDNVLSTSWRLSNFFTNVIIRMDMSISKLDSAANKRIYIDSTSYRQPQERIGHEMGHLASYIASRASRSNYGQESLSCGYGGDGWYTDSIEVECTAFEEGLASYVGTMALYSEVATNVRTCWSDDHCFPGSSATSYPVEFNTGCTCGRGKPQNSLAYLWDVTDSSDSVNLSFSDVVTALYSYDEGCGNHQVNEQYTADGSWDWDNVNGRSSYDFYYNMSHDELPPTGDEEHPPSKEELERFGRGNKSMTASCLPTTGGVPDKHPPPRPADEAEQQARLKRRVLQSSPGPRPEPPPRLMDELVGARE